LIQFGKLSCFAAVVLAAHLLDLLMKNFSTVGTRYALAALFAAPGRLGRALTCEFRPMRRTATWWSRAIRCGTSPAFPAKPWCWPTVWGMNRDEIANPHWIYPGQIIWFDRAAGRLRLGKRLGEGGDPATSKAAAAHRHRAGAGRRAVHPAGRDRTVPDPAADHRR
jgi:hypothetical protein